jgi:predicted transposase YbfD/YdcC
MLLLEQLKQIPDHRGIQGRKYPLWLLMSLIVIGKFCGHEGYRPIADFCIKYREKLWRLLKIDESLPSPSYSTLRRTMMAINPIHWEIEVARELIDNLKQLPTRQCFSVDALHTQTLTVEKIIAANHSYLIAVKENQPTLYANLDRIAASEQALTQVTIKDYSHGRFVQRRVSVFEAPEHLKKKWRALKTLIKVERIGIRNQQDFRETAYLIGNESLDAEVFSQNIQGHWKIENRLHWVKDVPFQEDYPPRRGGYAPINWAILFSWLITLVRRAHFRTVPQALRLWANQIDEIFALLS